MKVEYINPFIDSVQDLFTTMLGCQVECGNVGVSKEGVGLQEITALIGLSGGQTRGTIAMLFPEETALAMVGRLLGMEIKDVDLDHTVSDALGEMVNIIAGGAKVRFSEKDGGPPIDLSLPNVVRGTDYKVDYPSQTTWLDVPFSSELGRFHLQVTFELQTKEEN